MKAAAVVLLGWTFYVRGTFINPGCQYPPRCQPPPYYPQTPIGQCNGCPSSWVPPQGQFPPQNPPPNTPCNDCQYTSSCINATPINYSIEEAASTSPRFVSSLPNVPSRQASLGTCFTYIDIGQGVYLQFRLTPRTNGDIQVRSFLITDVNDNPGQFILIGTFNSTGNSFFVSYETIIANATSPCDSNAFYRCNVYKTCGVADDLGSFSNIQITSSSPYASQCCVDEVKQDVYDSCDGYNISGFIDVQFSPTEAPTCVCSFNGIDVINRDSLPPNTRCLELPE